MVYNSNWRASDTSAILQCLFALENKGVHAARFLCTKAINFNVFGVFLIRFAAFCYK